MALRALLFSKNPETADSLTAVLREAGIRAEVCADIFAAMEKGTKQPFACILVDWSDQPEAGFLLKRARESGQNRNTVAIAIVEDEPTPDEERENRLDFLIFRPIAVDEARAVLAKARQQMQLQSTAFATDSGTSLDHPEFEEPLEDSEDPNLVSTATDLPEPPPSCVSAEAEVEEGTFADEPAPEERPQRHPIPFRPVCAAVLAVAAAFCLWRSREAFRYLAQTREGTLHVLQESVLFYVNRSQSVGSAMTGVQPDPYFTRTPGNANTQSAPLGVVSAEITLPDTPGRLRAAFDFPLPVPELHVDPLPARVERAQVPDSLKSSAPIARPVVVTVGPGQMMPVSTPPPPIPQYGEPVHLNEEAARALVVHSVDPVYPPEAMAQKLQGTVVLQATIGRDGSVQDLKLVRGYFALARAAIAAVKQWRFRPSSINGRPVEAQTVITVNFSYPPG
ncbi:MAG: TonB family protein [Candidatus Koribacter versatilis]|nr:TonB family protein [Candidatus Koribacter versatilis]